jgi:hypothetical protein
VKKIKALEIEGKRLSAERFLENPLPLQTSFDKENDIDAFHTASQRYLLDAALTADPAERFQLLRNEFDRNLFDAVVSKDLSMLMEENSLPSAALKEAKDLLDRLVAMEKDQSRGRQKGKESEKTPAESAEKEAVSNRLFDIFVQTKERLRFSKDFADLRRVQAHSPLGDNTEDPLHWSKFALEHEDEKAAELWQQLVDQSKRAEEERLAKIMGEKIPSSSGSTSESTAAATEGDAPSDEVVVHNEDNEEVKISLLNPSLLMDEAGDIWSGVILDTDVTQKTMPGNRVLSHRALVVVGKFVAVI